MSGSETYERQVAALAAMLRRHYRSLPPAAPPAWRPPHRVLDVALAVSLEADAVRLDRATYAAGVVAPVEAFRHAHPHVATLADLRAHIASHATPADFARHDLRADGQRGALALTLVEHLRSKLTTWSDALDGPSEPERLAHVLDLGFTSSTDAYNMEPYGEEADGVGEVVYAYLRMRLGAPIAVVEGSVLWFVQEVLGGVSGDTSEQFGAALRAAALPPVAVLQALGEDRARARVWSPRPAADRATDTEGVTWVPYLEALAEVVGRAHPRPESETLARLHRDAPHGPPGAEAARRGDHVRAANALRERDGIPSYATVADRVLRALHTDAAGYTMDAEVEYAHAHEGTARAIRELRAAEPPAADRVLRSLRRLFERTGARSLPWHRTEL